MRSPSASARPLAVVLLAGTLACGGKAEATPVPGGDPERGRQQIAAYGCGSCHLVPGVKQAEGMVGPPLIAFSRRAYIAGQLPNTADNLIRWIVAPQQVEPGTAMPDLGVGEGVARDMAAYLYTLR